MMKTVLVPIAKGFEEIEAVSIIDVLRRAHVEVIVAASLDGSALVVGANGITIETDHTSFSNNPNPEIVLCL